jgi:hypothetical protein
VRVDAQFTVTILRDTVTGKDGYGNDARSWVGTDYDGCVWWQRSTSEDDQGRATVTTSRGMLVPDGVTVDSSDRVRFVDGTTWRVQGSPAPSLLTGARRGVTVVLEQVTG